MNSVPSPGTLRPSFRRSPQQSLAKVRDSLDQFKNMPKAMRPTFHEIRGLGGALYLEQGFSKEYVNLLMGHTTQQMTDDYSDLHITWISCSADLRFHHLDI